MRTRYSNKYRKKIYEIFAGEYYVTEIKDIIIQTLLGSCVAVCMRDKLSGVLGINHFMLPDKPRNSDNFFDNKDSRYGINAMELMINDMMKKGAVRNNLEAKIFGGGKIIKNGLNQVAQNNIDFILNYLKLEKIPVKARDLGGDYGRKILIIPDTFEVFLKKVEISALGQNTINREKKLLNKTKKKKEVSGDLTLFT